ncbi:hypothetical protein B5S28_g835 [[Candida] boidinii]|nr:hypothetical protein B5S28_g835 [[Candida] boidinii]OWB61180.1 hypothetical protein B5S29_g2065 [[Candida] boidinii]
MDSHLQSPRSLSSRSTSTTSNFNSVLTNMSATSTTTSATTTTTTVNNNSNQQPTINPTINLKSYNETLIKYLSSQGLNINPLRLRQSKLSNNLNSLNNSNNLQFANNNNNTTRNRSSSNASINIANTVVGSVSALTNLIKTSTSPSYNSFSSSSYNNNNSNIIGGNSFSNSTINNNNNNSFTNSNTLSSSPSHIFGSLIHGNSNNNNNNANNPNNSNNLNSNQHVSQDQNLQIFLTGNGQFVFLPYNPVKKRDTSTNQDENDDDEGDDDDSEDENNNNNSNSNSNSNNTPSSSNNNNSNSNSKKRRHHHNVTNHNFAVIVRLAKSQSLTSVVKAKYRVNIKTKWPSGILGTDESGKVRTVFKENYSITPLFEWSLNMKNPDCFIPFKPQHHQSTNSSSSLPQQQQQQQRSNSKKTKLPNRSNTNKNLNFSGSEISSTSDFDQNSMGLESKYTNNSYDDSVIDDDTNYDDDFNFEFQENESISTNTNNSISSNQMITSKEPTQEIKYFELLNQHEYKTETADLATENFFLKDTPSYSDSSSSTSKDNHHHHNHIDTNNGVPKFFAAGYYIFILPIVYPLDTPETVSTPLTSISHNFDIQIEKLTLPALPPPQSALLSSTNYHNHHTNPSSSSTSANNPNNNHTANDSNTNSTSNHNSSHNHSHNHDTNQQDSYLDPYYNTHNNNNHINNPLSHITSNSSVLSANSTTSGSGAGGFFKSLTHYGRRHSVSNNNNNHNNNNENSIPAQLSAINSNNSANNGLNIDYSDTPINNNSNNNNNNNNNNNAIGKKKNSTMQPSNTDIVYGFDYELPIVRLPPSDATSTLNKSIYVNKIWNNALNYEILLPKKYVQLSPMSGTSDNFMKNHTFILQLKAIPLVKNLTLKRIKINVVEKITYISKDKKYEEDVGKVDQSGIKERTVTLYEIKTKEKNNSNALKSKIIPGCTNDNLLTFCYNGGKTPTNSNSLLTPNHDRKDTFLNSNSRSRSGSGSIFSSSRLNRSRSLSSFMDNSNNNNSVNTTNSVDEDEVIITNPVKVKCPLIFQAADETGLLNEIHENLCKGQADLNEPLVEENLNKNVSNDDVISIFSNNSTNTLLDTGIIPTENIIYTNDGIKTEEVLAPSSSLNRNLSTKSVKSHRKSSFGAHANNSNNGNSNDPGAFSNKLSGFHPDATFGNVKIRHRLQVCFRISKPDEKDIREGVPKIHHYEVIVDTPIVFVSPFCVRDNLDLPSYEYAVRSNTIFDFDNTNNNHNNRDSSDAFSFDRVQESNDEIEDQLPTFDEAILLPSSPMQSSMMPNMSNIYSGGFNSTTVLSASPFSINSSSIAFGSPSSLTMSTRDDTLGTFNNIDSLVAGDMSQLSLNNAGSVSNGRSGSSSNNNNNDYRNSTNTNEISNNTVNSIDATLSLNVPTRNSVTGEKFGVPSNPSTPIVSQQSHSFEPIDFAKRNSESYQDKSLSNSLTTSGGVGGGDNNDTIIKNDGNFDNFDNGHSGNIGKLSNMFKQQQILDNSNTNTNNSSRDGEINYPQSYFPDSNGDDLDPIGPAITHIPTQSSIKYNVLHPTESNGYTNEPPTYDMVIKEDQLKTNGGDDGNNKHEGSNDIGSDLSSGESMNRVSDEESDGDVNHVQNKYYRQNVDGAGGYEERLALLSDDDDDEDADNSSIVKKIGNSSFINKNEVNKHYTNLDEKLSSTNGLIYETPNGSTNQLNDDINLSHRRDSNNIISSINTSTNRIKDNLLNSNFTNINTKDTINTPTRNNNSDISLNSYNNENENDDLNTLSGVSISNLDAVELTEANRFF